MRQPVRPWLVFALGWRCWPTRRQQALGGRGLNPLPVQIVEVGARRLIYLMERADTGLHIVELTGPARAIANPLR